MINIKKIGLTALAASLVSTSAFAADFKVKGAATTGYEIYSGDQLDQNSAFTMGNQLTFSSSGELENGLKVSLKFLLDQGDDTNAVDGPFDSHEIKISSEALGTFTFAGEGGKSASTSIDTTAAGDIWDLFDGSNNAELEGVDLLDSDPSDNSIFYTSPAFVEGLNLFISLAPGGSTSGTKTDTGYGVSYKGVEGLSASYAITQIETTATNTSGEQTALNLSYAYGPITAAFTNSEFELGAGTAQGAVRNTADTAQTAMSYSISYSISEAMSVSYGTENYESPVAGEVDAEFAKISAAYTAGGMTISANRVTADNIRHSTDANQDLTYHGLGISFNF